MMLVRLFDVLNSWQGDHQIAAYHKACDLTRHAFLQRVEAIATNLENFPQGRWALFEKGSVDFAIGLLALLKTGREPVILPHMGKGLLQEASKSVDGFLVLRGISTTLNHDVKMASDATAEWTQCGPSVGKLTVLTSGTTAGPTEITKSIEVLERECSTLEEAFGEIVAGSMIYGTVSHQHIYGLLFRVLWPVMSGRVMTDRLLQFPEEVHSAVLEHGTGILVSSPAFLKRSVDVLDRKIVGGQGLVVFSSGGPLHPQVACEVNSWPNTHLIEVYGSTETGGVAWRQAIGMKNLDWQTLPGVNIRSNGGVLEVSSPHLETNEWYLTQDNVEMSSDGGFQLLGRQDRIAKIEEKRVNLSEMERALVELPEVIDARILIDEARERGTVGVVQLSSLGFEVLASEKKRGLRNRLSQHLGKWYEIVTLPRRWRFVKELPENTEGKVTKEALISLFHSDPLGAELPPFSEVFCDAKKVKLLIQITPHLDVLNGHFPQTPIVSGIAQIGWAVAFIKRYFRLGIEIDRMEGIKFIDKLVPNMDVTLTLELDLERSKIRFEYRNGERIYSSGRLCIRRAA